MPAGGKLHHQFSHRLRRLAPTYAADARRQLTWNFIQQRIPFLVRLAG
jgi:hypothetical protein